MNNRKDVRVEMALGRNRGKRGLVLKKIVRKPKGCIEHVGTDRRNIKVRGFDRLNHVVGKKNLDLGW